MTLLPLYQGADVGSIAALEMYELLRFRTSWTMLCLNKLVIKLVFQPISLILLPGSIMKTRLLILPFFTVLRISFLLMGLAFIDHSNWSHMTNHQSSLELFQCSTSTRGTRGKPRAGFWISAQKWSLPPCQRSLTLCLHAKEASP